MFIAEWTWWRFWTWGQDILDSIISVVYGLLLTVDCIIYSFVSYVYQVFTTLAGGSSGLIDEYFVGNLVDRIYIIMGVAMLFIVAYSLLRAMINVDDLTKGKKSPVNLIKDVLISIGLIAFVPTIFSFAFQFQNALLKNNTIGKIIVGNHNGTDDAANTIRMGGYKMAEGVFGAFMHADVGKCNSKAEEKQGGCETIVVSEDEGTTFGDLWVQAEESTTFWALSQVGPNILEGDVRYYFLISPIAGIFVLFVLLSYCFDMALRLVKLAVYEIIAPLPILARVIPNEQAKKVFSNWIKATVSTFVEVFIRIAILYFAVFLIANITGSLDNIFSSSFNDPTVSLDIMLIAKALVIIGIIMFVFQAPKIIKEITGLDGGKYNVLKSAKQGFSLIAGGVAGGSPLAAMRAYNQAGEAKLTDFSAVGNQFKRKLANRAAQEQGASWKDRTGDKIRHTFGYESKIEQANRNLDRNRDMEGNTRKIVNDTGEAITIKLPDGSTRQVNVGGTINMTDATVTDLQHRQEENKISNSKIDEQIRHEKDYQGLNNRFIEIRSKIKSEAIDKIKEGDSTIERSFTDASGTVIMTGNYKSLSDYVQGRINAGASADEIKTLNEQLKNAENEMWVEYSDKEIAKGNNTKIGSLHQQGLDYLSQAGGYYNATTHKIEQISTNINQGTMEVFEGNGTDQGLDKLAKSNNSLLDTSVAKLENSKIKNNSENAQIGRLLGRLSELKTADQNSPKYQAYKAADNANKIKESGKR